MCSCFSKKEDKDKKKEAEPDIVLDTQRIYFDEYGNLIYNQEADRPNREDELRQILTINPGDSTVDGLTWYLMDAP